MVSSIGSNLPPLGSQNSLAQGTQRTERLSSQIASGKRITDASVDPAGSAILSALNAQLAGQQQALANLNDGVSYAQTADGALAQLQDNTDRMQTLAVQAGDGALNADDRSAIQAEADQLGQSNRDIVAQTQFNGQPVLQGGSLSFQAGANAGQQISVASPDLSGSAGQGGLYGAGSIDLSSQASASQALDQLASDQDLLSSQRTALGAVSNRFASAISGLAASNEATAASSSRIGDTDYAAASAQLAQEQIRSQAGIAVQAQANASAKQVLALLG